MSQLCYHFVNISIHFMMFHGLTNFSTCKNCFLCYKTSNCHRATRHPSLQADCSVIFLTLFPGTAKDIFALCQHQKYSLLAQTCSNECSPSSPGYLPFCLSIHPTIHLSIICLFISHYHSIYRLSLIYHLCMYVTIIFHLSVFYWFGAQY